MSCTGFVIFSHTAILAQSKDNITLLQHQILSADSVVIISHEVTAEFGATEQFYEIDTSMTLDMWKLLHPPLLKYLENGNLNKAIVKESLKLTDSNKINLIRILLRPVILKKLTYLKCNEPRHSVIIYKGIQESYIDICFGCRRIHTSKDIDFAEFYFDDQKWLSLKGFFKTNGLTKLLNN